MNSILKDLWRIEVKLEPEPLELFPIEAIVDEDHNKDWR